MILLKKVQEYTEPLNSSKTKTKSWKYNYFTFAKKNSCKDKCALKWRKYFQQIANLKRWKYFQQIANLKRWKYIHMISAISKWWNYFVQFPTYSKRGKYFPGFQQF